MGSKKKPTAHASSKGKAAIAKRGELPAAPDVAAIAAQIRSLTDFRKLRDLHDRTLALGQFFSRRQGGVETINACFELVLRADRRLGALLVDVVPHKGGRPPADENGNPGVSFLAEHGISKKQSKRWQELAKIEEDIFEAHIAAVKDRGERLTLSGAIAALSHSQSYDSDEWFTPAVYIAAVRRVLGDIDLDPATCEQAQRAIGARVFYTKQDSGLAQPWMGRVYLNPPFSMGTAFADKLVAEYEMGNVHSAIMLQNSSTDVGWFHALAQRGPVCLVKGRIGFERADGKTVDNNRNGQTFFCLGPEDVEASFVRTFGHFGLVGELTTLIDAIDDVDEEEEAAE